jgi:hypothetical protein
MRSVNRFRLVVLILIGSLLTSVGCGGGGAPLEGRILVNGNPYQVTEQEEFQLGLITGEGDAMIVHPGEVAADGTFKVSGMNNDGVPPGTYKITVESIPYGGGGGDEEDEGETNGDRFQGKFNSENTQLILEIGKEAPGPITIDLGKGTISK